MTTEENFTAEEIGQLRKLLEIEKIRKKKVLYSHLIDGLELERYSEIYAEDVVCEWGPYTSPQGRKAMYEYVKEAFKERIPYYSFHMTTNIWIELTSPTTAVSRSYLLDVNNDTNARINPINWFGVYEENWEKIDGDWKIKRQWVQFIWPKRLASEDFPHPMPAPAAIG